MDNTERDTTEQLGVDPAYSGAIIADNSTAGEGKTDVKVSKRALPFALIALVSSILVLAWNCYWSSWYVISQITGSCTETGCGDAYAWTLIYGTFGNVIIMIPQLLFGFLSRDLKTKHNRVKNAILLVTLILTILSILSVIIAWIYTFMNSH